MKYFKPFLFAIFIGTFLSAQVGVNTLTIDPSAALDIQYGNNPKGLLTPRMTTLQRTTIATPADGLIVYDTTEKAFYFFNITTATWMKLGNEGSAKRNNYKLIKSAADLAPELAAGGGSTYLLTTNTYYEINGTITLAKPIDLNNAYMAGLDSSQDILSFPGGTVFKGSKGGNIKNLTLKGENAFEIAGPGIATNSSLFVQYVIIDGMTSSVGSISGFGVYLGNIIQFINNKNGITYSNIGNLLLNNQGWFDTNNGTFETLTGTFGLIGKVSGFSTVNGSDLALDVSALAATSVTGTAAIQGTAFLGSTTNTAGYVNGYTIVNGAYPGYNFSNAWYVDAPGIPREGDAEATGDINFNEGLTGTLTSLPGSNGRTKVLGKTKSNNLFRFVSGESLSTPIYNRITYVGNKSRYFQVSGSVSLQGTADNVTIILYLARNGVILEETKVFGRASNGFFVTDAGILALPIVGTVKLEKNQYIEIFAERYSGSGDMRVVSLNLTAR
ncbi:MAG: hypothetical protein ACOH1X_01240 [Kaistella sp.]